MLDGKSITIRESKNEIHGVGAYLINLDRAIDRYNYVYPSIIALGYPFERISGVDGKAMSEGEINQKVDFKSYMNFLGHHPKRGMVGCTLSHIKTWHKFLESDYEFALIFEDDVSFNPAELKDTVARLIENKQYWDMTSFELSHRGTPLTIKHLTNGKDLVVYLTEVTHAGAYLINRKAAHALLEKSLPIKMPNDYYFTRSWEFGLKFTGVEPRLVRQSFGDSDIRLTSANYTSADKEGSSLTKVMFKLQSYTIRFLYNLKIYIKSQGSSL